MAEIRAFRGLRFDSKVVGDLREVVAPPYDVIDAALQRELHRRNPHNIVRLELGEQHPSDNDVDNRYSRAAQTMRQWLATGALRLDPRPAVYVYQHEFRHHGRSVARTGFLASMRLEEWRKGIVLPHEATMSGPKLDRLRLMRATEANFSPIFALYEDSNAIARNTLAQIVDMAPSVAFERDGEAHRVWVVDDGAVVNALATVLRQGPVYIADGHHRYETALYYRDEQRERHPNYRGDEAWNFLMMLLVSVDDPGLLVLPTHRLVNPRSNPSEEIEKLSSVCSIETISTGADRRAAFEMLEAELARGGDTGDHVFGVYGRMGSQTNRGFALLRTRELSTGERVPGDAGLAHLDVSLLQELILCRAFALGETDFEGDSWVGYTRDEAEAIAAVDAGRYRLAIFVNPTRVEQVLAVARARQVMPRKSTYFHPKPLTGIVLNLVGNAAP